MKVPRIHDQSTRYRSELDEIQALKKMQSPSKSKEVQSLEGRVATLSRFVLRETEKCPFSFIC